MKQFPQTIQIALVCYVSMVLLGIPSSLFNILNAPADFSRPVMFTLVAITLGLLSLNGYFIFRAKNWARILFAVLMLSGIAMEFVDDQPMVYFHDFVYYAYWTQGVLGLTVVVFVFLPTSNAWFAAAKKKN